MNTWTVIDTDTESIVASHLSYQEADALIDELRLQGLDCFMQPEN